MQIKSAKDLVVYQKRMHSRWKFSEQAKAFPPYREIILTARIMDEIFPQIYPRRGQRAHDGEQREAPVC
jgi:hypothetical protein